MIDLKLKKQKNYLNLGRRTKQEIVSTLEINTSADKNRKQQHTKTQYKTPEESKRTQQNV